MNHPLSQSAEDLANYSWQQRYYNYDPEHGLSPISSDKHSKPLPSTTTEITAEGNEYFFGILSESAETRDALEASEKNYIADESAHHLANPLFIASLPSDVFIPANSYTTLSHIGVTPEQAAVLAETALIEAPRAAARPYSFRALIIGLLATAVVYISGYEHGALYQQRKSQQLPSIDFPPLEPHSLQKKRAAAIIFTPKTNTPANTVINPALRKGF